MNGHTHRPITEDEIVAARVKAAEGDVPWNRTELTRALLAKHKALAAARKRRRRILWSVAASAVLMLALLAFLFWRTRS